MERKVSKVSRRKDGGELSFVILSTFVPYLFAAYVRFEKVGGKRVEERERREKKRGGKARRVEGEGTSLYLFMQTE